MIIVQPKDVVKRLTQNLFSIPHWGFLVNRQDVPPVDQPPTGGEKSRRPAGDGLNLILLATTPG